jgi:hypothetical protein
VPTHSPVKIAQGIQAFIHDVVFRNNCIEKGLHVAERFSLKRTKKDLIQFIERLHREEVE